MAKFKRVYMFDEDLKPVARELAKEKRLPKDLLGGKGSNLFVMTNAGLPVPPGFTVTCDTCIEYQKLGRKFPPGLEKQIMAALAKLEKKTGKKFGDKNDPLLVSVRSGARDSMPGMMDTVLNLGLNEQSVQGLIKQTKDPRFAWDAYRRFIMMYSNVVLGIDRENFERILGQVKKKEKVKDDTDVSAAGLREVALKSKALVKRRLKKPFPDDPKEQLIGAIRAVFDSWNNDRAIAYRNIHKIPHTGGTAVNVQVMVFGNTGEDSGTGVAFTRDPATGEKVLYGDYLPNAQGEDVVAGVRTPMPISELKDTQPEAFRQFVKICDMLEKHQRNMQDMEFTVEHNKLWMLQTRDGKRTAAAAVKIAVDMVDEGLLTEEEAVLLVEPDQLDQLLHPQFDAKQRPDPIASGVPASPGAAAGKIVLTAEQAVAAARKGERVVLVRHETNPDDIRGMDAAQGILTALGGKTSHAAVVARQMGKPCVAGCAALDIDYAKNKVAVNGKTIKAGDYVSIDGTAGEVMEGDVPTAPSEIIQVLEGTLKPKDAPLYKLFARFMPWADRARTMGVRTNADTPEDAHLARVLGAEGIGLTRTEHMFFGAERIRLFQQMILADTPRDRARAAAKLKPYQRKDFEGILKAMDKLPVIIRLLDPPLHEFLPREPNDQREVAKLTGKTVAEIRTLVRDLHEANPMLGHRGCRLGVTFPEIYKMQAEAIFEAACNLKKKGFRPIPEVMIPLVGIVGEFEILKKLVVQAAEDVMKRKGVKVKYMVGTMIELPRAALRASEIGALADFFSYGTNDLTQTTYGFSRDDVEGKFIPQYIEQNIIQSSPFDVIDRDGVGELVRLGTERGRAANPKLEVGICGEHGGEPKSVEFCHEVGLDYVSCSALRVPIARLAAAQAAVKEKQMSGRKSRRR